jgi:hypothetical protein
MRSRDARVRSCDRRAQPQVAILELYSGHPRLEGDGEHADTVAVELPKAVAVLLDHCAHAVGPSEAILRKPVAGIQPRITLTT